MVAQHGNKKLRAAFLLLTALLPLLAASPAQVPTFDSDESAGETSDWQLGQRLAEELSDTAEAGAEEETPHVQVEATKRLWIAELREKADHAEEAADLIDEIRSRTSSSGLTSLKAACMAMCPKCICGVILLPSLPSFRAAKVGRAKSKKLRTYAKPAISIPTVATTKAATKPAIKPMTRLALTVTPRVTPKSVTAKQAMSPQPTPSRGSNRGSNLGSGSAKKTKKWLLRNHAANVESQLPDFLLDEEGNGSAYKREVDDHDPLSASGSSEIGIE